jgi:hypothetical protein
LDAAHAGTGVGREGAEDERGISGRTTRGIAGPKSKFENGNRLRKGDCSFAGTNAPGLQMADALNSRQTGNVSIATQAESFG